MTPEAKTELRLRVQSKKASLAEALTSTIVGLVVAFFMNVWLLRYHYIDGPQNHIVGITSWMTLVSVIRGYILRRLFNTEFWKRWRTQDRVVKEGDFHIVTKLTRELDRLSYEQKSQLNPRLIAYLDKELERVLYGSKR